MHMDDQQPTSSLDRLTQRAALAVSRRGFLKRLTQAAAAVGLGMVAVKPAAAACSEYWTEYDNRSQGCGSCGFQSARIYRYRRDCCWPNAQGQSTCGSWTYDGSYCTSCA